MSFQLPPNFPPYDTSLSLLQKRKIWNSLSDIQPFIEDYFIVPTQCLLTGENKKDINIYIFLKDSQSLSNVSDKFVKDWKIDISFLKATKNFSFIILPLPKNLVKEIYPNDPSIHLGGSIKCFHDWRYQTF